MYCLDTKDANLQLSIAGSAPAEGATVEGVMKTAPAATSLQKSRTASIIVVLVLLMPSAPSKLCVFNTNKLPLEASYAVQLFI